MAFTISSSCRSVAASNSSRLRARSAASNGLRHTISRSSGKSGETTSAKSRSSNSERSITPCSAKSRIVSARSAVIQSKPSTPRSSSSIRRLVIIPRSPTNTTRLNTKSTPDLSYLSTQGFGVSGITREYFDRNRTSLRIAQQTVNNLRKTPFAVTVVAELDQVRPMARVVTAGHVIENERSLREVFSAPVCFRSAFVAPRASPMHHITPARRFAPDPTRVPGPRLVVAVSSWSERAVASLDAG